MSKFKSNIWLNKPWILGLFIFLPLATVCIYAVWVYNGHGSLRTAIPVILTALILCAAGTILLIYVSRLPSIITEFVAKSTASLRKSEQRNRGIVNALPDLVFIVDNDGKYLDFNNSPSFPVAMDPDHFILRKVSDVLPPALASESLACINKVLQTGELMNHQYQMETRGEIRSFESRYMPYAKDEVLVLVRDTTNTKLSEQRIRENEDKYRILVEQATDGIFIANFQGNFLVVNPAGCKMSLYNEDELLKMRFYDLAISDDVKQMPFKLSEIASGNTVTSERKMKRKDGVVIDVEIAARIIAPNRFLAFVRDISERKKAENELLKSRESLRQLTHYIENVREEERLHTAKEIHDQLGQQLAVLKMDVLKLNKKFRATDELSPDMNELLETINGMIETVRKIASDLRPGILDDIGLIATMDWFCQDFSKKTKIATTFISDLNDDKLPQKLSIIIFRIMQESLANIAKHSRATKADVSLLYRHQRLVVIIEDNGLGFNPAALDPAKAPGIQAMKERAITAEGTYNINSEPGRGTIVELIIPLDHL